MDKPLTENPVDFELLFRSHLKEHHNIETQETFTSSFVQEHLTGRHTLIPISVFSNTKLSALETIVKYLKENEGLKNIKIAKLLGRSPAAIWITYKNTLKKEPEKFTISHTDFFIPTTEISESKLSVLESISHHLLKKYQLSFARIARILGRDERTIWTVCARARRKLA